MVAMNTDHIATQEAPYPLILADLVKRLTYKEDWYFALDHLDRGQGSEGLTLSIRITAPDSVNPGKEISVVHYMIVPPAAYNQRHWERWLLDQILLVEQHEACEFFKIDGERIFGPHHAPGNNPYTIFEHADYAETKPNYRG